MSPGLSASGLYLFYAYGVSYLSLRKIKLGMWPVESTEREYSTRRNLS
jgi:hypothetical protein